MLSFITAAKGTVIGIAILGILVVALIATPGRTAREIHRVTPSGDATANAPAISPTALTLQAVGPLPVIDGPMH